MTNITAEHILLGIIIALSGWTLQQVVSLKVQLASLPCRKCGPAAPVIVALAFLLVAPLSADPVTSAPATNAISGDAAGTSQTDAPVSIFGSPTDDSGDVRSLLRSTLTTIVEAVPWRSVENWFAGVALPALVLLWRKYAKSFKIVRTLIWAVENSAETLGPLADKIKTEIRNQALKDGTQTDLHSEVKKHT